MAYTTPTFAGLREQIASDIDSRLAGADSLLRRSTVGVLAYVVAAVAFGLYGFIGYIAKQIHVATADTENLERKASMWVGGRTPATKAGGTVTFTGTDTTVIPAGTAVQRSDGITFTTDADGTIAGGSVDIVVTADEGGKDGNTSASSLVSLVSPIAGVDGDATVDASGLIGGADVETDDKLRARVEERIQNPPHGGADFDYVKWAKEVAGVTRAWPYPQELGGGTVTVRFMMDDNYADGIPLAADVTAVQDYIDIVRPVTADVTVVAPTAVALNFNIAGLSPSTAAVKQAIEDELRDLIEREAEPGGTILVSHIREAISIAAGESDHVLASPVADVTHTTGQIATFGVITW